jgi:hypothetical protein
MHVRSLPGYNRINGIGELIEVTFREYIDPAYFEMFGTATLAQGNPCTGKPWGVPERDCYACSLTMSGAGNGGCSAHGVRRVERVIK